MLSYLLIFNAAIQWFVWSCKGINRALSAMSLLLWNVFVIELKIKFWGFILNRVWGTANLSLINYNICAYAITRIYMPCNFILFWFEKVWNGNTNFLLYFLVVMISNYDLVRVRMVGGMLRFSLRRFASPMANFQRII